MAHNGLNIDKTGGRHRIDERRQDERGSPDRSGTIKQECLRSGWEAALFDFQADMIEAGFCNIRKAARCRYGGFGRILDLFDQYLM